MRTSISFLAKLILFCAGLAAASVPALAAQEVRVPLKGLRVSAPSGGVEPGTQTPPVVSLALADLAGTEAAEFNLGSVVVGARLNPVSLRLVNKGSVPVRFSSPRIQVALPFVVLDDNCGAQLVSNSYCNVTVTAAPLTVQHYSGPVTVSHADGSFAAGSVAVIGETPRVEVMGGPLNLSGAPNTEIKGTLTLRNLTDSAIKFDAPVTDFSGPIQVNTSGTATLAANSTTGLAIKFIGAAPGTYQIPITYRTKVGTTYSPVVTATVTVTITANTYANHATETLYAVTTPSPYIERINYAGRASLIYTPQVSNDGSVSNSAAQAIKVTVPANAVSPLLTMWGSGRDGSTITILEGSPSGKAVYVWTWDLYYSSYRITTNVLQPGKTYFVIPKMRSHYASTVGYLNLSWN